MKPNTNNSSVNINGAQRPIDVYFKQYDKQFPGSKLKWILAIVLFFFYLGLIGLFWIIPFPLVKFLAAYNGYFNWASFLIAFLLYYWLKQSPILSYFLLFFLLALSYIVTLIVAWYHKGGISAWLIFPALIVATVFGLVKITSKRNLNVFTSVLYLPVWLLHKATGSFIKRY